MINHIYSGNRVQCVYWNDDRYDLHREDCPAVVCPNGYRAWYLNGLAYTIMGGQE